MKEQRHTSLLKASAIILLSGLVLAGCSGKNDTHQQAKVAPKTEKNVKASNNKTDKAKLDNKQPTISKPAKVSGSAYTGKPDPNPNGYRVEHLTKAEASSEKKAMSEIQKHHDAHGRKQLTAKDDSSINN